jgi:hypothetical protein
MVFKIRGFSAVQRGLDPGHLGLVVQPLAAISEHLRRCPYNVVKQYYEHYVQLESADQQRVKVF